MKRIASRRHLLAIRLCCVSASILLALSASISSAGIFTLVDENSVAGFDTESDANNPFWVVDGTSHLFQQAFWYRVGNTAEQSVHFLPVALEGSTDTNFDGDDDTLFVRYDDPSFRIEVRYGLDGGSVGSYTSNMSEQISIRNMTASPLDFHFFQYVDFDLNGSSAGDSAVFTNANAVQQYEGSRTLTETVITPVASHREIAPYSSIIDSLDDLSATTLSDSPAIGVSVGPDDLTWAFQWDLLIAPGDTILIDKHKGISGVPEPTGITLLATMVLAGLGLCRK